MPSKAQEAARRKREPTKQCNRADLERGFDFWREFRTTQEFSEWWDDVVSLGAAQRRKQEEARRRWS